MQTQTGQLPWSAPRTATVEAALTDQGLYRSIFDPATSKWIALHNGTVIKADAWTREEAEAECLSHYMSAIGWAKPMAAMSEQRSFAMDYRAPMPPPRRRGRPRRVN